MMKPRVLVLLLLGAVLGAAGYLLSQFPRAWPAFNRQMTAGSFPEPAPGPTAVQPATLPATGPAFAPAGTLRNEATPGVSVASPGDLLPEPAALAALEETRRALRLYASRFGANPVGANGEITRALNGHNPGHANFIRPEAGMRLNEKGELVDLWGTPYFFHQLSGTQMEIRAAGPDRMMWTADDLVVR